MGIGTMRNGGWGLGQCATVDGVPRCEQAPHHVLRGVSLGQLRAAGRVVRYAVTAARVETLGQRHGCHG